MSDSNAAIGAAAVAEHAAEHAALVADEAMEAPASQTEVIAAEADAAVARIEAEGEADVARIEAAGEAAEAVAEAQAEGLAEWQARHDARLSTLETQNSMLQQQLSELTALASLIRERLEPPPTPIPETIAEVIVEPSAAEGEAGALAAAETEPAVVPAKPRRRWI